MYFRRVDAEDDRPQSRKYYGNSRMFSGMGENPEDQNIDLIFLFKKKNRKHRHDKASPSVDNAEFAVIRRSDDDLSAANLIRVKHLPSVENNEAGVLEEETALYNENRLSSDEQGKFITKRIYRPYKPKYRSQRNLCKLPRVYTDEDLYDMLYAYRSKMLCGQRIGRMRFGL